jgi:hypothetical protein
LPDDHTQILRMNMSFGNPQSCERRRYAALTYRSQ